MWLVAAFALAGATATARATRIITVVIVVTATVITLFLFPVIRSIRLLFTILQIFITFAITTFIRSVAGFATATAQQL